MYKVFENINEISEFISNLNGKFVKTSATKLFGNDDWHQRIAKSEIRWNGRGELAANMAFDGVPFVVLGKRVYECVWGRSRQKGDKKFMSEASEAVSFNPDCKKRKYCKVTPSRKLGCTACAYVKEIVRFPDFAIDSNTKSKRSLASRRLRDALARQPDSVRGVQQFFCRFPADNEHAYHDVTAVPTVRRKKYLSRRVRIHIEDLVNDGVCDVTEMQQHISSYLPSLFEDNQLPRDTNRTFFPENDALKQIMEKQSRANMRGLLDQEQIQAKLSEWIEARSDDVWYFQPSVVADDVDAVNSQLLLFHQTGWQCRLLMRYGQELVFLCPVHRTIGYAVPLYLLFVHSNDGYIPVATMIVEEDESTVLSEALEVLKTANPVFTPKGFMIDRSDVEMTAVGNSFPDSQIFICDFYRKSCWRRAVKDKNSKLQHEILTLLNSVAESRSEQDFEQNWASVQRSTFWQSDHRLQKYITDQWMSDNMHKRWAWAFRKDFIFMLLANDGIAAQERAFRFEHLEPYRLKTLSNMLSVLVNGFFKDAHHKYVMSNMVMCDGWWNRQHNIQPELHYRPRYLLQHLKSAETDAANITSKMIFINEDGSFRVQKDNEVLYRLDLGDDGRMPSCDCEDFVENQLPCKHFFAIFCHNCGISWTSLPSSYRDHPLFVADLDCFPDGTGVCTKMADMDCPELQDLPSNSSTVDMMEMSVLTNAVIKCDVVINQLKNLVRRSTSVAVLKDTVSTLQNVCQNVLLGRTSSDSLLKSDSGRKWKPRVRQPRNQSARQIKEEIEFELQQLVQPEVVVFHHDARHPTDTAADV